jgi:hypothetical protein
MIAIILLVLERIEKNRPYLQISFEIVRSTLACIVFRNTGNIPLLVSSIKFDSEFLLQLEPRKMIMLERMKNSNLAIFPGRFWVLSLDVNVFDIIEKFTVKSLRIEFGYEKMGGGKTYIEDTIINFDEYSNYLVYLSEVDELRQSIEKNLAKVNVEIKRNTVEITTLTEHFKKRN